MTEKGPKRAEKGLIWGVFGPKRAILSVYFWIDIFAQS